MSAIACGCACRTSTSSADLLTFPRCVEIARQNQLQLELIRSVGHPEPRAGLDIEEPARAIDDRVDLMRLIAHRVEFMHRPEVVVFLDGNGPYFRKVVGNPRGRREVEILQA